MAKMKIVAVTYGHRLVFQPSLEGWVEFGRTEVERRTIFRMSKFQEVKHSNNKVSDG